MLCPGVRSRRMAGLEVLSTLPVDVSCVVHVPVVGVAATVVVVVVVSAVVIGIVVAVRVVICVVVAVATVVATVVITTVPRGIPVVRPAVIDHRRAVPATIPTAVSPAAAPTAHQCADGDPSAEPDDASCGHVSRAVPRSYIRRSVNYRGVVFRDVDDLRVRGLNNDRLWGLLHHGDLGAGLEIAG